MSRNYRWWLGTGATDASFFLHEQFVWKHLFGTYTGTTIPLRKPDAPLFRQVSNALLGIVLGVGSLSANKQEAFGVEDRKYENPKIARFSVI